MTHPAVPARRDSVSGNTDVQEVVSILDPSSLMMVVNVEVFIVPVAELVLTYAFDSV